MLKERTQKYGSQVSYSHTKGLMRSECCQAPGLIDIEDKLIGLVFIAANV